METGSENTSEDTAFDLLEFDSIGSWADEVESDLGICEGESESASDMIFNPKYAFQAENLRVALPDTSADEQNGNHQEDERSIGEQKLLSPLTSTPSYKWKTFSHQSPEDSKESKSRKSHNRRSGDDHETGNRHNHDNERLSPLGANYSRDSGGLSPLRSPLNPRPARRGNQTKRGAFRRRKPGDSHSKKHVLSGIDEDSDKTQGSESASSPSQTVISEEEDGGTPILTMWQMKNPAWARSRRRLSLPDDTEESESPSQIDDIAEDDAERLARREKDIAYGKSTESYKKYIKLIPYEARHEDMKVHPRTPLKTRRISRRSWDAQVRIWKRRVHFWAAENDGLFAALEPEKANSGRRWADVVAGSAVSNEGSEDNISETATENIDPSPSINKDESFPDGSEIEFNDIADKLNDSIRLNDSVAVENVPEGDS